MFSFWGKCTLDKGLDSHGDKPKAIFLSYRWRQVADVDPQTGLALFFLGTFIITGAAAVPVLCDWGRMNVENRQK
jgi:hypothetical protein